MGGLGTNASAPAYRPSREDKANRAPGFSFNFSALHKKKARPGGRGAPVIPLLPPLFGGHGLILDRQRIGQLGQHLLGADLQEMPPFHIPMLQDIGRLA